MTNTMVTVRRDLPEISIADNCSHAITPSAADYLSSVSTYYKVLFGLSGVLVLVMILIYVEEMLFMYKHLHHWQPKSKAKWLLGVYPVFGFTSLIGLLVPRSQYINDLVALMFLSLCIYLFLRMVIDHHGGQEQMIHSLAKFDINLQVPPVCCCCFCLPKVQVTSTRLWVIEGIVLQFVIVRPLMTYIEAVMWVDFKVFEDLLLGKVSYPMTGTIQSISTLLAIWGHVMAFRLSKERLENISIKPKFYCLQLVQIFSSIQHLVLNILVSSNVIKCEVPLNAEANMERIHHLFLILEMFFLSIVARAYYRRHVTDSDSADRAAHPPQAASGAATTTNLPPQAGIDNPNYADQAQVEVHIDEPAPRQRADTTEMEKVGFNSKPGTSPDSKHNATCTEPKSNYGTTGVTASTPSMGPINPQVRKDSSTNRTDQVPHINNAEEDKNGERTPTAKTSCKEAVNPRDEMDA